MSEAPRTRRRRWPRVLGVLAVLLLIGGIWVDRQLQPARLATTVLSRLGPTLGLELTFDGEPDYALRPEPRLVLPGFAARQPGAATPLLTAKRAEVSLPWDTITGGDSRVITRVQLDAPVLDLAALAAWQATRPDEPFELPTLTKGLEVTDGTIVGAGWNIAALALSLPDLKAGAPVRADASGRFERGTTRVAFAGELALEEAGLVSPLALDMTGTLTSGDLQDVPWSLALTADLDAAAEPKRLAGADLRAGGSLKAGDDDVPWTLTARADATIGADATAVEFADAEFRSRSPLPDMDFAGHATLAETLRFGLGGVIPRWPEGWPALPAPLSTPRPMAFSLGYAGAGDLSDPLRLRLARDETRLDTRLVLPELLAWMDRDDASPLPPLDGTLDTPRIVVGAFTLDGVHVEFDDDGADADGPFATVRSSVRSTEEGGGGTP